MPHDAHAHAKPMQERARRTRAAIVAAGAHLVAADGVFINLEIVRRTADVTKGAAYFHFPSKQDLFLGISAEALDRCAFVRHYTDTTVVDPRRAVRDLVDRYAALAATDSTVRADAVLWADPVVGETARAGVHDLLHDTALTLLTRRQARTDAVRFTTRAAGPAVETMVAALAGIGSRAGSGAGFADPTAHLTVRRVVATALSSL